MLITLNQKNDEIFSFMKDKVILLKEEEWTIENNTWWQIELIFIDGTKLTVRMDKENLQDHLFAEALENGVTYFDIRDLTFWKKR